MLVIFLCVGALIAFLIWQFPQAMDTPMAKAQLASTLALLAYLLLGIRARKAQWRETLQNILAWIGIALVILVGYVAWPTLAPKLEILKASLVPATGRELSQDVLEFNKSLDGHFRIHAKANGETLLFMVDSGATSIVLSQKDAQRLGIDVKKLSYTQESSTANGSVFNAPIVLESLEVGPFVFKEVTAVVSGGGLDQSLLGMSFLNRFSSWTVNAHTLTLKR